jgi:hypothetical protein
MVLLMVRQPIRRRELSRGDMFMIFAATFGGSFIGYSAHVFSSGSVYNILGQILWSFYLITVVVLVCLAYYYHGKGVKTKALS